MNQDGSTKVTVYRKLTHTDQYLNFHSNHHLQHKRAVVNTLLLRAKTLVSEEDDRVHEIQHVKQAFKTNNYPHWMLTIPNTESDTRESEESRNEKRVYASVPYIKGISERLQRAFKSHEVTIVHKPVNSLRSQLVQVKDKTESLKKCGTVYHIVINATNNTSAKLLACLKPELRNIFQGIHQPFTNIASSRDIQWIPAKQKFSPRKATRSNAA